MHSKDLGSDRSPRVFYLLKLPAQLHHLTFGELLLKLICLVLAASLFACMSATLWAAVAPEPEGSTVQVINAHRTELVINK